MQNALKYNEGQLIYVNKTFKIQIQKRRPNNLAFLQNWLTPEIRSHFFNLQKYQDSEKSTPGSWRIHWNLMNNNEFRSTKSLKFKYRRGDQII